ncbi:hypothetical protein JQN58_13100 [Aneurinibacillus sp. BA2021]|nr:hypothetical protein [Aneurinibacillus sp. BA2021]
MKKYLCVAVLSFICLTWFISNKEYYPPLPISSIGKKEAISTLHYSSGNIAKIAEEGGYDWYITRMEQGRGYTNVIQMMNNSGWSLQKRDGNGLFFMKKDRTIIVTTEMWTGKYILCKVPKEWRNT